MIAETYVELLRNGHHWAFELTLILFFDVVIGALLWPRYKAWVRRHDAEKHGDRTWPVSSRDVRKTIYVAGPMRGKPQFNFPAFDAARDLLDEMGWNVISPADMDRGLGFDFSDAKGTDDELVEAAKQGFTIEGALRRDFAAICTCDAIAFLPGWEKSSGARAERFVAEHIGLKMYHVDPDAGSLTEERHHADTEEATTATAGITATAST